MKYEELEAIKNIVQNKIETTNLSNPVESSLNQYRKVFDIEYTHHSTAIEGNTLTLLETKLILEDQISVGGKPLREIYEVENHDRAFQYVKGKIEKGVPISEGIIKEIHRLLTEHIFPGGIYRTVQVYITGASTIPPDPQSMVFELKKFYEDLPAKSMMLNPVELAAWAHAEFVRIHPFPDGNGRTARLIMNYLLMESGFAPVNIKVEERHRYYKVLDEYTENADIENLVELITKHEYDQLLIYLQSFPKKK